MLSVFQCTLRRCAGLRSHYLEIPVIATQVNPLLLYTIQCLGCLYLIYARVTERDLRSQAFRPRAPCRLGVSL